MPRVVVCTDEENLLTDRSADRRLTTLQLDDVEYAYPRLRGKGAPVLHGINWRITQGVTGVIGANGSGKTTLLSLCAHLTEATQGSVSVFDGDGNRVSADEVVRTSRIALVPQSYSFEDTLTVRDTLRYLAWVHRIDNGKADAAVDRVLNDLNLANLAERRVGKLSGGQRQRVALGCGLVPNPQILILDEPTVGLDPAARIEVREILHRLGRTRTVILSTHLIEDLRFIADSVAVLREGSMRFSGPFREFAQRIPKKSSSPYGDAFENAYRELMLE